MALVAVGIGAGCIDTSAPSAYAFRYQISAYACDTSCAAPDSSAQVTFAARGDTVWLQHAMSLVGAADSFTPKVVTLRPDCDVNVLVVVESTILRTLPTPTCPDSTYPQGFQLAGIDYPSSLIVYTRWVVDSQLSPGPYGLQGRVVVQPRLEPRLPFDVQ